MIDVLQSPSVSLVLATVTLVLFVHIIGEINEALQNSKARKLANITDRPPRTLLSIVVEASNETIFQTLNNLKENSYRHLEIIVFVTSRSDRLLKDIRRYQRSSQFTKFRVITGREGLTQAQFIKKYTSGSLVMSLKSGDSLDACFVKDNVVHFKDPALQAVVANESVYLTNSLKTALFVGQKTLNGYLGRVFVPRLVVSSRLQPAVIYRKNVITKKKHNYQPINAIYIDRVLVTLSEAVSVVGAKKKYRTFFPIIFIILAASLIGLSEGSYQVLFTLRALTAIALVFGLLMWQRGGMLRSSTKLSIVLLTPFTIVWPWAYTSVDAKN